MKRIIGYADRVNVECKRKRGVKDNSSVSPYQLGSGDGEDWGKSRFGSGGRTS